MKYDKLSRRFFLQGLGGSLLSLPILPSIIPRAQAQALPEDKFLVILGSGHGGTRSYGDWLPMPVLDGTSNLLSQHTLFPVGGENNLDHIIRHARLNTLLTRTVSGHPGGNVDGSSNRLSYIFGDFMNPHLSKMNLFRGLDGGMFYLGHCRGMYGGNLGSEANPSNGEPVENWPTLDQFLASSPKFYTNPQAVSQKIVTNSSIISQIGDGTSLPATTNRIDRLYAAIFDKFDQTLTPQEIAKREKKEYLVDRVWGDYKRFLTGAHGPARRISSVDKIRVEQHIDNLVDIQNKYKSIVNSCGDVTGPKNNDVWITESSSGSIRSWDLLTDLIVSGFSCGANRLASLMMPSNPTGFAGDYHQSVAHSGGNREMEHIHNTGFRWQAENIVAKMISKLDAVSVNGQTGSILDNGLVMWTHECGPTTHQQDSIGFATFGSLGGYFKTGNYLDYRNYENKGLLKYNPTSTLRPGIPIQGMWSNIIQGFGISRAEFERHGRAGYSETGVNDYPRGQRSSNLGHQAYPSRLRNSLSDKLPIIT